MDSFVTHKIDSWEYQKPDRRKYVQKIHNDKSESSDTKAFKFVEALERYSNQNGPTNDNGDCIEDTLVPCNEHISHNPPALLPSLSVTDPNSDDFPNSTHAQELPRTDSSAEGKVPSDLVHLQPTPSSKEAAWPPGVRRRSFYMNALW